MQLWWRVVMGGLYAFLLSGCFGSHGSDGGLGLLIDATRFVVTVSRSPPPIIGEVENYATRSGQIWVNGSYQYDVSLGRWAWHPGHWQPDRPDQIWIQGHWRRHGEGFAWVDGHWTKPVPGQVYCDGYWRERGNGYEWVPGWWEPVRHNHIYVGGSWEPTDPATGRRKWSHGRWQRDDGRPEWAYWRQRSQGGKKAKGTWNLPWN